MIVEPYLVAQDYQNAAALRARLSTYLDEAKARGWITPKSVIVLPEHIGTWLVAANAPAAAYRATTLAGATIAVIADDPVGAAAGYFASREEDRAAAGLFRARGARMAKDYGAVFGALARDYGVTIVAGSIVLENPAVEAGAVVTRRGLLYNVSAVFEPDGGVQPTLVFKRQPIPSELAFLSAGDTPPPVFSTPAGRLGVLVCADSWHPENYAALADADIIAVPAFLQANDAWTKPWGGYVTPEPDDLDQHDIGALTEGEAWRKYAMPTRIASTAADAGATAFLRGAPWDLGADGRTLATHKSAQFVGEEENGGAVSVLWR